MSHKDKYCYTFNNWKYTQSIYMKPEIKEEKTKKDVYQEYLKVFRIDANDKVLNYIEPNDTLHK